MNGLTQWVKTLPPRPSRGLLFEECQHPKDDRSVTMFASYTAVVCGWCGAAAFFEDRG